MPARHGAPLAFPASSPGTASGAPAGSRTLLVLSLLLLASSLSILVVTSTWSCPIEAPTRPCQHLISVRNPHRERLPLLPQANLEESWREAVATTARSAISAISATSAASAGTVGLVRVHGQVRWGARPASDYDLVFQPLGRGPGFGEGDWDFTDKEGRYEVELSPATYAVLSGDGGPCLTYAVAPKGKVDVVLDIDLR